MKLYEITNDHGCPRVCLTSDTMTVYVLTSAYAHDLYNAYLRKYCRCPSQRWYQRHFKFTR